MVRLHLLGFTPDFKGLVFSGRRGGRAGTYWVPIDDSFRKAVAQIDEASEGGDLARGGDGTGAGKARADAGRGARGRSGAGRGRPRSSRGAERLTLERFMQGPPPAVTDTQDLPLPPPTPRVQSKLPPREIQSLLREGRSVRDVSGMAGVEEAWVERFLGPVLHEMAGIVQLTLQSHQSRPRLGTSGLPVGEALVRNLRARRATSATLENLDRGWDARRVRPRTWRVRLRFNHRNKKRLAEWEFRTDTRSVQPRNKLASELGWWAEGPGAGPRRPVTLLAGMARPDATGAEKAEAVPPGEGTAPIEDGSGKEPRGAGGRGRVPSAKAAAGRRTSTARARTSGRLRLSAGRARYASGARRTSPRRRRQASASRAKRSTRARKK